jgi:TM2 domain-containing membrane protein YozV
VSLFGQGIIATFLYMHLTVFKWLVLGGAMAFVFTVACYFYLKKNRNLALVHGSIQTIVMVVIS